MTEAVMAMMASDLRAASEMEVKEQQFEAISAHCRLLWHHRVKIMHHIVFEETTSALIPSPCRLVLGQREDRPIPTLPRVLLRFDACRCSQCIASTERDATHVLASML